MPKVEYSATKGLIQTSGSGFQLSTDSIQPSVETLTNQHVDLTITRGTTSMTAGSVWDNGYILLYGKSTEYVVWFNLDTVLTVTTGAQPNVTKNPLASSQAFLEVKPSGDSDAALSAALETAINTTSDLLAYADTNTVFEIVGATPYKNCASASRGSLSADEVTALAQTTTGSGNSSLALSLEREVSILKQCNPNLSITDKGGSAEPMNIAKAIGQNGTATPYTLAAGHEGQRKLIIISKDQVPVLDIAIANMWDLSFDDSGADTISSTTAKMSILDLVYANGGWFARAAQGKYANSDASKTVIVASPNLAGTIRD